MPHHDVGMRQKLRINWRSVMFAVGLHIIVVVLLVVGVNFSNIVPAGGSNPEKVVDAVVINSSALPAPPASKPEPVAPQAKTEPAPEPKPEPKEQPDPKIEQQKQAEAERKKAAAEAQKEVAVKKAREQAKLQAQAKKKAEAEAKRKAAEEAKEKAQAEAEAKKKAQAEAKKKAEAEAQRKAQAQAKKEAEAKKQAEKEAKERAAAKRKADEAERRKAALQQALDAEAKAQQNAALAGDRSKYAQLIKDHVEANWLRPPGAGSVKCQVRVDQLPNGGISKVELLSSCGSKALDRSVEKAIYKSDPLPLPANRDVFQRELIFTFEPQQ